jgi:hypothetical protein
VKPPIEARGTLGIVQRSVAFESAAIGVFGQREIAENSIRPNIVVVRSSR